VKIPLTANSTTSINTAAAHSTMRLMPLMLLGEQQVNNPYHAAA